MVITTEEMTAALAQYHCTSEWHRNPLYSWMLYTDGVNYFADKGGAYWFVDIIGTELHKLAAEEPFLSITLKVKDNQAAIFVTDGDHMDDGSESVVYIKRIEFTDCVEGEWKFFLTNGVLLLPSEY